MGEYCLRQAKTEADQPQPFNARAETVATSPMFRDAFKARRCLMPASSFFEWKGEKGSKQRFRFALPDDEPFAFTAIFNTRRDAGSCCLITTTPNPFMADYHNHMPVILDPRDYGAWLDPHTKPAEAKALLIPWAGELSAREDARKNPATLFE